MNKIMRLAKAHAVMYMTFDEERCKLALEAAIKAEQDYTRAVISERDQYMENTIWQAKRIAELTAELGDLPEAQAEMLSTIKQLRKELAELRLQVISDIGQEIDAEPCAEIVSEDMGRPFNAMQIRTHFYKEVPPVGTQLYTHPPSTQPKAEPVHRVHETDIYEFAAWLTTRKGVMEVGSSKEAGPMAEAVGEYLKKFAAPKAEPVQEPVYTKEQHYELLDRAIENCKQEMRIKDVTMRCKGFDLMLTIIDSYAGHILVGDVIAPQDGLRKAAQQALENLDAGYVVAPDSKIHKALREALNG